jgi:hypothetical protein
MTSITDVTGQTPSSWFRWQPEWTLRLLTWVVGGLITGGSAGLGAMAAWQGMQADVRQTKADVASLRAADAEQAQQHAADIARLAERQAKDDQIHAAQDATGTAIQADLKRLYEELRDFRRDLTGRGIR